MAPCGRQGAPSSREGKQHAWLAPAVLEVLPVGGEAVTPVEDEHVAGGQLQKHSAHR